MPRQDRTYDSTAFETIPETELSVHELEKVTGGDFHFVKVVDKASPNLFVTNSPPATQPAK
jgi:type VI protein secretion system component Hcp